MALTLMHSPFRMGLDLTDTDGTPCDAYRILRLFPAEGWKLLLSLLPSNHDFTSGTYKPKWQQWAAGWQDGVTDYEHHEAIIAISDLLIANASNESGRWISLVEHLTDLPISAFDKIVEALHQLQTESCSLDERNRIWSSIRSTASRHRWASGLAWAASEVMVQKMEALAQVLAPSDLIELNRWLFASGAGLHIGHHGQGVDEMERVLLSAQVEAIRAIWAKRSFEGISDLGRFTDMPSKVGIAVWKADLVGFPSDRIPPMLIGEDEKLSQFARGYLGSCFGALSWSWLDGLDLNEWPAAQVAELLYLLPFQPRVWELAASLGNEAEILYWKKAWCQAHKLNTSEVNHVVSKLYTVERIFSVIDFVHGALFSGIEIETEVILNVLEKVLFSDTPTQEQPGDITMLQHHIGELYRAIRDKKDAPNDRLVAFEWASIDVLNNLHLHPVRLHQALADDPTFFATLLTYCYRARSEHGNPKVELSQTEKRRANRARKLLESWIKPPGRNDDGSFDVSKLVSWVREARLMISENDRQAVGDIQIGKVLFNCPADTDGKWPCLPIRDLLEDIGSAEMLRGFELAIINNRGVHFKFLTEGGEQERQFAKTYEDQANTIRAGWPLVAATLDRVAANYKRQAERQDEEAYEK